jgi:hypothetical protein
MRNAECGVGAARSAPCAPTRHLVAYKTQRFATDAIHLHDPDFRRSREKILFPGNKKVRFLKKVFNHGRTQINTDE